jgi:hypothetical protein
MTLSNAVAARVRLIGWRKACQHQVEPDPASKRSDTARANRSPRVVRAAIGGLIDVLLEAEDEPAG